MFITLIENLERLIEYPIDIYHAVIRVAVSALIPIALANYYPTVCMLGEGSSGILLYIAGACVILGVIDVLVWKKGMKAVSYTHLSRLSNDRTDRSLGKRACGD